MPRKPKVPTPPVVLTEAEQIQAAADYVIKNRWLETCLIAAPTRTFEIGESVFLGGLENCVVVGIFQENKLIVVKHDGNKHTNSKFHAEWWFEVDKQRRVDIPRIFETGRRGQALHGTFDSLIHLYMSDGLVCDPEYQRGYVWNDANKEALLDSVFERLEIGSFSLMRKHGYLHKGDTSTVRYVTLTGEVVDIPKEKDYTVSIIDGQQRLTTLMNFYLDKLQYRGTYFSQLNNRDRNEFAGFSVQYRLIEQEEVTRLDILKMFLQANRGVPQAPEHIAKVQALYEQEKLRVQNAK